MGETPLRGRVRNAVLWRSGSQFAAQLILWGSTLVVIRLLAPSDYGLMAMTQVVAAFLAILSGQGFASSVVQARDIDERQVRQMFGLLILVNVGLALVQLALAPYAAAYYSQPLVADLLRVQAAGYLFVPLIALPTALRERALDFRVPATVQFWASLGSAATTLVMALLGAGVWSLVAGQISLQLLRAVGLVIGTRWLVMPSFDFAGTGRLFRFGSTVMATSLLWFIYAQSDIFIAGRVLDAHAVGVYATALFLAQLPVSKFLPALNEVGFSAYARIQHDRAAVAASFLTVVRLITLVCFPTYVGLAVTAAPFTDAVLGPQWLDAIIPLRLLALAMLIYTVHCLIAPAVTALGRPGLDTFGTVAGLIIMPASFLIGVRFGAAGLCFAWLLAFPLVFAIAASRCFPVLGVGFIQVAGAAWPALAASLVMAAITLLCGLLLAGLPSPALLIAQAAIGALSYASAILLLFRERYLELLAFVRR